MLKFLEFNIQLFAQKDNLQQVMVEILLVED